MRSDGRVHLVGAGPGDPELMTLKAHRLLDDADVVMHDSLVGDEVLEEAADDCDVHNVGKSPDGGRTPQAEINRTMVEHARSGEDVVRLKGGDPFVFGRGGEEIQHLAAQGVEFQVVPGVSSAVAGAGSAGVPVTHREHASSLTVVTGHEDPSKEESSLDWNALASNVEAGGTLVILMGVRRMAENVDTLRSNGVGDDTPAAVVERATLKGSRCITGPIDRIVEQARERDLDSPAVVVVGDVVEVREEIVGWMVGRGPSETVRNDTLEPRDSRGAAYHG